jgi:hypothetical protein
VQYSCLLDMVEMWVLMADGHVNRALFIKRLYDHGVCTLCTLSSEKHFCSQSDSAWVIHDVLTKVFFLRMPSSFAGVCRHV